MSQRQSVKGAARKATHMDAKLRKQLAVNPVTKDSFQNFMAQLGKGTGNLTSFDTYGFNPITRVHTLLEWIHRGSWVGGVAVDIVAEDMTRAGVDIKGNIKPKHIEAIEESAVQLDIWNAINDIIKWGRLFGGGLGVLLIDGQDPSTEFRIDTVGKNQFKGILVLDRWMVEPDLTNLVTEYGPSLGMPKRYRVNTTAPAFTGKWVHYSRCIRAEGIRLPYWQRLIENLWSESVLERLYDRLTAFDAASTGAAQLVHKMHLRTYKIADLRSNAAAGGDMLTGLTRYIDMMRKFQTIEGITLMDKEDEFEASSGAPAVAGVADLLLQFGQQLAGALGIPLVRLFGMSPAGMNATGESDMRNYYDGIAQKQQSMLRVPMTIVYRCIAQSLAIKLPDGFKVAFRPLWQMTDKEKAEVAQSNTAAICQGFETGLVTQQTAMQELRQSSEQTGVWRNITDEQIAQAEVELPPGLPVEEEVAEVKAEATEEKDKLEVGEKKKKKPITKDNAVSKLAWYHDLPVVIENPAGTERRGVGWITKMPADYGYIQRTIGADEAQVDCYVGPAPESTYVFVVNQRNLQSGAFDEHKVMLGYYAQETAVEDYVLGYTDGKGAARIMDVIPMRMTDFKKWLGAADLSAPCKEGM